jgi:(1->4)-alpha-D-glucan 1-alpha-D-glucosylmutase
VQGARVDHPDGLYDPLRYLRWLRAGTAAALPRGSLYLVVEKILAGYEHLSEDWPIQGTNGYEFCNAVNGLLVEPQAEQPLTRTYTRFTAETVDFGELLYLCNKLIMRVALTSELNVLASRMAESDPATRDFSLNRLREALVKIVACFPV